MTEVIEILRRLVWGRLEIVIREVAKEQERETGEQELLSNVIYDLLYDTYKYSPSIVKGT